MSNYIFVHLKTAKGPVDLRVNLSPAHLSTTHCGGCGGQVSSRKRAKTKVVKFTLSLILLNVK